MSSCLYHACLFIILRKQKLGIMINQYVHVCSFFYQAEEAIHRRSSFNVICGLLCITDLGELTLAAIVFRSIQFLFRIQVSKLQTLLKKLTSWKFYLFQGLVVTCIIKLNAKVCLALVYIDRVNIANGDQKVPEIAPYSRRQVRSHWPQRVYFFQEVLLCIGIPTIIKLSLGKDLYTQIQIFVKLGFYKCKPDICYIITGQ